MGYIFNNEVNKKKSCLLLFNLIIFIIFSSAVFAQGTGNKAIDWSAVSVVVVVIGMIIGWLATRRQKSAVADLMTKIDFEYSSYKMKPSECEKELYRLRNAISDELKKGKIDTSSYSILDKRIDDYLVELRQRIASDGFEGMPGKLKGKLSKALEDGAISGDDLKMLTEFAKTTQMSDKKKAQFEQMIKEWKKEDSGEMKREEKGFFGKWLSKIPWTANRIAIFSIILAILLFAGAIGVLTKEKNPGGLIMLAFGILTLVGGIYLKMKKQSGIKILKIAYWILIVFFSIVFFGGKQPIGIVLALIAVTVAYHLKYLRIGAESSASER